MSYYVITCYECKGDGEVRINPKPTISGTKYDIVKCPLCDGLGSILCSEKKLTKIS